MPWTTMTTRATGYTVTAAVWNEIVTNFAFLERVAYPGIHIERERHFNLGDRTR